MVTLNKPSAGDTDWTTEINDNWTNLESSVNGVVRIVKTTDESLVSSTTLQDDNELRFAIGANETWQFQILGFWSSASTTPDIKVALNGPASPTTLRAHVQHYFAVASGPDSDGGLITSYGSAVSADVGTVPDTLFEIRGSVINGSTPGTFVLQWAQRASSATATVVKAGSYLVAHRV